MSAERGTRNAESKPVLVCFALKEEAVVFKGRLKDDAKVSTLITGIGKDNTRRTVLQRLDQSRPALVLTCGFAGGLDPNLSLGEVIFETVESSLCDELVAAGAKAAKFFCAPQIATTAAEKIYLRSATDADAVEMESETVQHICRDRGIPCATVRVISDIASENLPLDFNALGNSDQSLNFGKLAWAVIKSPGKIPALLRLQKNSRTAAAALADVLIKIVAARVDPQPARAASQKL
jgi:nucleoside phosphorylase